MIQSFLKAAFLLSAPINAIKIFKGLMFRDSRLMIVSEVFGLLLALTFKPANEGFE